MVRYLANNNLAYIGYASSKNNDIDKLQTYIYEQITILLKVSSKKSKDR